MTDTRTSDSAIQRPRELDSPLRPAIKPQVIYTDEKESRVGNPRIEAIGGHDGLIATVGITKQELVVAEACGILVNNPLDDGVIYFGPHVDGWGDVEAENIRSCTVTKFTRARLEAGQRDVYDHEEHPIHLVLEDDDERR